MGRTQIYLDQSETENRYKTSRLYLDWYLDDINEYEESTGGDELPEYLHLDENEEGYTWEELEELVNEEEEHYGYEVEYWNIDDEG